LASLVVSALSHKDKDKDKDKEKDKDKDAKDPQNKTSKFGGIPPSSAVGVKSHNSTGSLLTFQSLTGTVLSSACCAWHSIVHFQCI
jgi:hypothetical protein